MPPENNQTIEILKIISPFVILGLTWLVGTRILNYWEIRKKRKELDILASSEFYKLYGEFTSVWRLWKVHFDNFPENSSWDKAREYYWELLKRSSNVEGGMEAVFVKLASEKTLNAKERRSLGLFRQAVQQLRQSVRDYQEMSWQREDKEYIFLKELSVFTARLINKHTKYPTPKDATKQLADITDINSFDWVNEVK
jgi:hypothetical protein